MCDFISGIIREKDEAVLFYDCMSHSETAEHYGLSHNSYREFEWTSHDEGQSLVVRVPPHHDKDEAWYKSLILTKWKTRQEMIDSLSKDVQLEAVKQNGYAIQYISNPDKDVQLEAVKQNGYAIQKESL